MHQHPRPLNERLNVPYSFDKTRGRVIVLNGDFYYSPNSSRQVDLPPPDPYQGTIHNIFDCKDARAEIYHQPRWWTRSFGWVAFVPIQPSYTGALFNRLSHVPTYLHAYSNIDITDGFSLPEDTKAGWMRLEAALASATSLVTKEYTLAAIRPFSPWAVGYAKTRKSYHSAVAHARRSRDWFSVWMGLFSYLIAEAESANQYSFQKAWLDVLLNHDFDQNWIDSVMSSTIYDFTSPNSRAGTFIRLTGQDIDPTQPPVTWFCHYNVPVWYRWGQHEAITADDILKPLEYQMQEATTWLTMQPASLLPSDVHGPRSGNSPPEDADPPRAYIAWFADRDERNKKRVLTETSAQRQTRLNRERQPPTTSAKVFIWESSDSDPKVWVRVPVLRADREDTLEEYAGTQSRYDSFSNEWDCCYEFGPGADDEDEDNHRFLAGHEDFDDHELDDPSQQPAPPYIDLPCPRVLTPPPQPAQNSDAQSLHIPRFHPIHLNTAAVQEGSTRSLSQSSKADALQQEMLEVLHLHYGFTPPLPLPNAVPAVLSENEYKKMIRVLGLQWSDVKDLIVALPIIPLVKAYLDGIIGNLRPADNRCDFNLRSRTSLASSSRLRFLRIVHSADESARPLYMFDFQVYSVAPWKLTLTTAANALLVCRLDQSLDEYGVARYLLEHGVPFHTLLSSELVDRGPREPPPPCVLPVRLSKAQFSGKDYDAYVSHRSDIVRQPRARAALLKGGYTWRLFIMTVSFDTVLNGPTGWNPLPGTMFVARDQKTNETFVDDSLTEVELNLISGAYTCLTGIQNQTSTRSWYPLASTFEAAGENYGYWNPYTEKVFWRRLDEINNSDRAADSRGPLTAGKWRDLLRGSKEVRRCKDNVERWSEAFITQHTNA
ncbi:hypothetical protein FPV67DRAFT_1672188 [Lyophyllum atratum]|nr:hypothetical protein FPV67DRAFT_1672188 [Lyophyllum atratum]